MQLIFPHTMCVTVISYQWIRIGTKLNQNFPDCRSVFFGIGWKICLGEYRFIFLRESKYLQNIQPWPTLNTRDSIPKRSINFISHTQGQAGQRNLWHFEEKSLKSIPQRNLFAHTYSFIKKWNKIESNFPGCRCAINLPTSYVHHRYIIPVQWLHFPA